MCDTVCNIFCLLYDKKLYSRIKLSEKQDNIVLNTLIEYIHENYSSHIFLDSLCKITHYSKPHIINLFKKHTGKTPIDYINRYKIYKAQEKLMSLDKNIIDIAFECGFDNLGYFNKIFKRYLGLTPGKWRKQKSTYLMPAE